MEKMLLNSLLIVAIFLPHNNLINGQETYGNFACPNGCRCSKSSVQCVFSTSNRIPTRIITEDVKSLDIRFSSITNIYMEDFKSLSNLETLILNHNRIKQLPPNLFIGLSKLKRLYLYNNEISLIDEKAFYGLYKLEILQLHNNNIKVILPFLFKDLGNLITLTLQSNHLTRLPRNVFTDLKNTSKINLSNNPIWCDCQASWLIMKSKINSNLLGSCEFPDTLIGRKFNLVNLHELNCDMPKILLQPKNATVYLRQKAFFLCKFYGTPKPKILWMHNDQEIKTTTSTSNNRTSILSDGTLLINSISFSDVGFYQCMGKNTLGNSTSEKVFLRIRGKNAQDNGGRPVLIIKPRNVQVVSGQLLSLKCAAIGDPLPAISWFKNDVEVMETSRVSHGGTGVLVIRDVQMADRARYTCVAKNIYGEDNSHVRVDILQKPIITQAPRDVITKLGEMVTLRCDVEGVPPPIIEWTLNGHQIIDRHIVFDFDATRLRVMGVQQSDLGVYQCKVSNLVGSVVQRATLSIEKPEMPVFMKTPQDTISSQKATISLACSAMASPLPRIKWMHDNKPIPTSNHRFYVAKDHLTISAVSKADSGRYTCEASNAVGKISTFANLIVSERLFSEDNDKSSISNFFNTTINQAINNVELAVNKTIKQLQNGTPRTPHELLDLFRRPSVHVGNLSRPADVIERTLELLYDRLKGKEFQNVSNQMAYLNLTNMEISILANLSNCMVMPLKPNCERLCYHKKYRSITGSCNNFKTPLNGARLTPLIRILAQEYDNGWTTPRGWESNKLRNGYVLPNSRSVSLAFSSHSTMVIGHETLSHMVMQWGQFIDHDVSFTPQAVSLARFSDGRFCNETCTNKAPCFPIEIPSNDPRIVDRKCIGFTRSSAICSSGMTSILSEKITLREQINQITAWIDASNVYGSDEDETRMLRDLYSDAGLLKEGVYLNNKPLLPYHEGRGAIDCQMDPNTNHVPCFHAGDHRSNEQLGLITLHTIFFREHNRIAKNLKAINPNWDSDMVFYETRKIVGAILQHITYDKWLPKILGEKGSLLLGKYKGYNSSVDSSISNEFSTAAFRFGHTLIQPKLFRLNSTFQEDMYGHLPLHRAFFAPFRILEEGGIDSILRGLFHSPMKRPDSNLNDELTEKLFKFAHKIALDLMAFNIQRGRDHGLATYVKYREKFGLSPVKSFYDLKMLAKNQALVDELERTYGSVENVDLYVGGILEKASGGSLVGDTFLKIIVDQFKRLRDGDRFWYEKKGEFSNDQLGEIKTTSLEKIICNNGDLIDNVTKDVFMFNNHFISCSNLQDMSFQPWAECCRDCQHAGDFFLSTSKSQGTKNRSKRSLKEKDNKSTDELKVLKKRINEMADVTDQRVEGLEMALENLHNQLGYIYNRYTQLERKLHRRKRL